MAAARYELDPYERKVWASGDRVIWSQFEESNPRHRSSRYVSKAAVGALAQQRGTVCVTCYRTREVWRSRERAVRFYTEAVLACEGAERDRYVNVLMALQAGEKYAHDTYDYTDGEW